MNPPEQPVRVPTAPPGESTTGRSTPDDAILVRGNGALSGTISVPGAKNSVLKLMASTLLTDGTFHLTNVPDIADVTIMGDLLAAINSTFTDLAQFKTKIKEAGVGRFGSGWSWLVVTPDKKLAIESSANQDSPLMQGKVPVLGVDVWEHAYYLRYQNRRADYLDAWWKVVNWDAVAEKFKKAMAK